MADLSGRTLGEFRLRALIGEGGYGQVYLAEQPALEREVVVKVLREERGSPDARERFLREARLAAQLRHPYAAQVYESGAADGGSLLWIAMEHVQGVSLADWLDKHGRMPPERFVPFFDHVCQVVQAMHDRGIVHRDLKPSNIMVVECGDRLTPKLLDLGIARGSWRRRSELAPETDDDPGERREADADVAADGEHDTDRDGDTDPFGARTERLPVRPRRAGRRGRCYDSEERRRLTPPDATLGSRAYMAPEMFGGADGAGPEADVYALGVVAYEALSGHLPLTADDTRAYVALHREDAPVPGLGDDLPPALDRAVRGALQRHGQARTRSALDLADDLWRALRTSRREQLRTSAQQWSDDRRPRGLLWGADVLEDTLRSVPPDALSELECSFVAESQRRIRRMRWARRALVVATVMTALATIAHHLVMRADAAEELANQAEVEEGRQAVLHDSLAEARLHLAEAYQRGDHSPATVFMLARALQPLQAEHARFAAVFGHIWSVALSSDGRQIVTADDGAAQVWDAQTHERRFTLPHGDKVYDARYSADRGRLVTACGDGTVRIWDAATGTLVRALKRRRADGKSSRYFLATFSPDSKLVAAIDTTGAVAHVWDAESGAPLAELRDEAADFPAIAFSADSRWLATSGGDEARVFDTHTWTQVFTVPGPRIRTLTFDPTTPRLATGSAIGAAAIWEIPSGARAQHLREVGAPVRAVAFSPDSKIVATGGGDGAVQFWDARSGTLRSQVDAIRGKVLSIEFDSTSERVVVAGDGGAAVVAETVGVPVVALDAPPAVVRAAHFDPTSRQVVSADWDGTARLWDATAPYRCWGAPPVADSCGLAVSLEPDRRFLAVGCKDRPTRVWDTAHDQLLAELPSVTTVAGDFASAIPAVSGAGDRAAIARGDAVEVYELPSGRLARTIRHPAAVDTVAFASAGHDLVSGATDGSLLVTRDGRDPIALPTSPVESTLRASSRTAGSWRPTCAAGSESTTPTAARWSRTSICLAA